MIKMLFENKEWIFSGIGVTVLLLIFKLIGKVFFARNSKNETDIVINQNSVGDKNTQIGIQKNYYVKEKKHE